MVITSYFIYRTTNLVNGKTYIGVRKRLGTRADDLYLGSGILIQKALHKYGRNCFKREILYDRISRRDTAYSMEVYAIAKYKPDYNIALGGNGGSFLPSDLEERRIEKSRSKRKSVKTVPWNKGKHHSEETRAKIKAGWHVAHAASFHKDPITGKFCKRGNQVC